MHELDPSYLGHLRREEVITLLDAVLAAEWGVATSDGAQFRAVLRRHLEGLGADACTRAVSDGPGAAGDPPGRILGPLVQVIRDALPRLHDQALRRDLEAVLGRLERGIPHRDGIQDKG